MAHVEALGELVLAGDGFPGLPLAGFKSLCNQQLDLPIKGLEGRNGGVWLHDNPECKHRTPARSTGNLYQ